MILGIDTSNYTTSAAVLDGEALTQQKQLLEVRPGERGLRQSDALFQHTRNLPLLFDKLPPMDGVTAVGGRIAKAPPGRRQLYALLFGRDQRGDCRR